MNDEYPDLPGWIRPGAKLAALSLDTSWNVVVEKITPTQIVCKSGRNGTVYRFYREARRVFGEELAHQLQGDRLVKLVRRDHTEVVQLTIRSIRQQVIQDMRTACTPRPYGGVKDTRSEDERAMELFDQLENMVRKARKKVENLLDPGGMVAAERAQELEPAEG